MRGKEMIANYHTHTYRCGHASNDPERKYVEEAIKGGLKILGFADHSPHPFTNNYVSSMRMSMAELEDYASTVLALKKEYEKDIEIHLGLEAEYYPALFQELVNACNDCGVEYFILGQHYIQNEMDMQRHTNNVKDDSDFLVQYCDQTIEAMETGLFTYFAHPDLICDMGEQSIYEEKMRELCRAANRCNVPVEINLLGVRDSRHYPNHVFWRIAGEENCRVILGSDAHSAETVYRNEDVEGAMKLVQKHHLNLINTVELRPLILHK